MTWRVLGGSFKQNTPSIVYVMPWKIAQLEFCEKQQYLIVAGSKVQIEPLLAEVLAYFCQHAGEVISRDRFIEQVWQGRIVTDNAVNRVIAKLRKLLADDSANPSYIVTLPKKGYRLIAPVTHVNTLSDTQISTQEFEPHSLSKPKVKSWLLWLLVGLMVLAMAFIWFFKPVPKSVHIQALTQEGAEELSPAMSPDGRYLLYTIYSDGGGLTLHLKDLTNQAKVELGSDNGWNGPAAWSDDSKSVVYLNTTETECRYIILQLDGMHLIDQQDIYHCPLGSFGKMIFSHETGKIIFAQRAEVNDPYMIYSLDLVSNSKQLLPQPTPLLDGNSLFDLHPKQNKLLISSPNQTLEETFYQVDLESGVINTLFSLNDFVCCGIWSHDGKQVVMMSAPPSNQLLSYALDGTNRQVLYSASHNIGAPTRASNGRDYLYSGSDYNRDIFLMDSGQQNSQNLVIANSVDDRLPRLSADGKNLAYVSTTLGKQQIWLSDLHSYMQQTKQKILSDFTTKEHFFALEWSPDGQNIAVSTLQKLYVVDVNSGGIQQVAVPQAEIKSISFRDTQTLVFSQKIRDRWTIYAYDIKTQQLQLSGDENWAFVQYAPQADDTLWVDQQGNIFYGENRTALEELWSAVKQLNLADNKLRKDHDKLYYLAVQGNVSELTVSSLKDNTSAVLTRFNSFINTVDFSVVDSKIVFTQAVNKQADIYQLSVH